MKLALKFLQAVSVLLLFLTSTPITFDAHWNMFSFLFLQLFCVFLIILQTNITKDFFLKVQANKSWFNSSALRLCVSVTKSTKITKQEIVLVHWNLMVYAAYILIFHNKSQHFCTVALLPRHYRKKDCTVIRFRLCIVADAALFRWRVKLHLNYFHLSILIRYVIWKAIFFFLTQWQYVNCYETLRLMTNIPKLTCSRKARLNVV